MRFFDILKLSLRMFKARTMRTLLTILGMSVGIAAIMFLVSLGYGLQRTLLEKITTSDALVSLDISPGKEQNIILNQDSIEKIRAVSNVVDIIPALELPGQGKFDTVTLDVNTVSTQPGFLKSQGLKLLEGRLFDKGSERNIVVTAGIAKVFEVTPETLLGKRITLTLFQSSSANNKRTSINLGDSYTIVGIAEGDDNIVYIPLDSLGSFPIESFSTLKVKCSSTQILEQVRKDIEALGLTVSSISETIDQANKVFRAIQIILMVFGLIALLVSAIGMFNTMTIALLERTEEIGIMKAIGASKTSISLMFVMEATLMGFLGSVGGIILGFLEGEIINILINTVATRFGGTAVDLFFSPLWFIMTVVLFGAFVGFLTGIFPARAASKIDTLDALRYK